MIARALNIVLLIKCEMEPKYDFTTSSNLID